jgi:hypothetical protein
MSPSPNAQRGMSTVAFALTRRPIAPPRTRRATACDAGCSCCCC